MMLKAWSENSLLVSSPSFRASSSFALIVQALSTSTKLPADCSRLWLPDYLSIEPYKCHPSPPDAHALFRVRGFSWSTGPKRTGPKTGALGSLFYYDIGTYWTTFGVQMEIFSESFIRLSAMRRIESIERNLGAQVRHGAA